MNTKIERIKQIAKELAEMFPGRRVDLDSCVVGNSSYPQEPHLWLFDAGNYEQATNLLRELGAGQRTKNPSVSITSINAVVDGVHITAVADTLPPTCRKEKYIERLPKTSVVELPGEFIEIERERVVCDSPENEKDEVSNANPI